MRKTFECPKCEHKKIWRIERILERTERGVSALGVAQHKSVWSGYSPVGHFEAWICDACGYSELYAQDFNTLQHDPRHGIHLIDMTPQVGPEGPER